MLAAFARCRCTSSEQPDQKPRDGQGCPSYGEVFGPVLSDEIGKWAGDITKVKLPELFLVDSVRVYDLVDAQQRRKGHLSIGHCSLPWLPLAVARWFMPKTLHRLSSS